MEEVVSTLQDLVTFKEAAASTTQTPEQVLQVVQQVSGLVLIAQKNDSKKFELVKLTDMASHKAVTAYLQAATAQQDMVVVDVASGERDISAHLLLSEVMKQDLIKELYNTQAGTVDSSIRVLQARQDEVTKLQTITNDVVNGATLHLSVVNGSKQSADDVRSASQIKEQALETKMVDIDIDKRAENMAKRLTQEEYMRLFQTSKNAFKKFKGITIVHFIDKRVAELTAAAMSNKTENPVSCCGKWKGG
jgi:hypothetical protein